MIIFLIKRKIFRRLLKGNACSDLSVNDGALIRGCRLLEASPLIRRNTIISRYSKHIKNKSNPSPHVAFSLKIFERSENEFSSSVCLAVFLLSRLPLRKQTKHHLRHSTKTKKVI